MHQPFRHHHHHSAKNRSSIRISSSRPPSSIPNEIVSLILHQLSCEQDTLFECTLVTKQFYVVANPLLWQVISLWDDQHTVARFLACISRTSPERLTLIGYHILGLHIQDCVWTDADLKRLLPCVPHLRWLTLGDSTNITAASIQLLPAHCHHLTSLDLCDVDLSVDFAATLGRHCRQLETFNFSHWDSLSPDHLTALTACPLVHVLLKSDDKLSVKAMAILRTWNRLKSLAIYQRYSSINGLLLASPPPATTPTPSVWSHLTSLSLDPCQMIEDATLVPFIQSHQNLTQLHLNNTNQLTDASLDAITRSLGSLTRLTWTNGSNISSYSVRHLLRQCRDLQFADFSDCDHMTTDLLRSIGGDSLKLNQWKIDVIRQEPIA